MALDPLVLLIDLLAAFRLTRLVVKDTLTQELRWWFLRRFPSDETIFADDLVVNRQTVDGVTFASLASGLPVYLDAEGWKAENPSKLGDLIECAWCAGMYVAAGVVALRAWWDWWQYPALVLALSAAVGLIARHVDND